VSTIANVKEVAAVFQAAAIEAVLRDALIANVHDQAELYGVKMSSSLSDLSKQSTSIDSLIVVEILCAVEPFIGGELPQKIVREGGYGSVDEAVSSLMPKIQKIWEKNQKVKVQS
jgi:hypothetical protein